MRAAAHVTCAAMQPASFTYCSTKRNLKHILCSAWPYQPRPSPTHPRTPFTTTRLNILEAAIKEEGWRFCRIDGSVSSAAGGLRVRSSTPRSRRYTVARPLALCSVAAPSQVCLLGFPFAAEREARVSRFQASPAIPIFLLTSQVRLA